MIGMVESKELYEFKKQLRLLSSFRGSGTELISVYIPAGSPIHETTNKLRQEMSQASNIKSKSTRTNVIGALERIIGYLKMYKGTPKNGLAVFCGNISDNPTKVVIKLFAIEPIQSLSIGTYRCDNKFFLEPLERMTEAKDVYGIVVMDGREATLALMKGTEINIVKRMQSTAHQKIRKGGQSARRFQRLIEESIEKYYKRIGDEMNHYFLNTTKGVIVGGPGPAKDFFMKAKPFNYQIDILGVVDTGYTDDYGVREVLAKSENIIAQQEAIKEKKLIDRFVKEVVSEGLATYGEKEVREAILSKQAEIVLLSEGLEYKKYTYSCPSCGATEEKISKEKAPERIECKKCDAEMKISDEKLLLDDLAELAKENNIEIEIISTNTPEGAQFLLGFGGIGAFLKYKK